MISCYSSICQVHDHSSVFRLLKIIFSMVAAVLSRPRGFTLQDVAMPQIKEDEIKIAVEGCGVCASSIPVWEGREWFKYPMEPGSPGHEGWGTVIETGSSINSIHKGDRVAFLSFHAYAEYDVARQGAFVKLTA